jgi:hypothetical protein
MKSMKEKNNNVIVIPTQSGHTQVWHRLAECTYNDNLESCPYTRVLLHSSKKYVKGARKRTENFRQQIEARPARKKIKVSIIIEFRAKKRAHPSSRQNLHPRISRPIFSLV